MILNNNHMSSKISGNQKHIWSKLEENIENTGEDEEYSKILADATINGINSAAVESSEKQ